MERAPSLVEELAQVLQELRDARRAEDRIRAVVREKARRRDELIAEANDRGISIPQAHPPTKGNSR